MARTSENLLLHQSREKLETLSRSTFSEFYTLIKNFQRYEESSLKKSNWIESQQQEQVALRPFFFFLTYQISISFFQTVAMKTNSLIIMVAMKSTT